MVGGEAASEVSGQAGSAAKSSEPEEKGAGGHGGRIANEISQSETFINAQQQEANALGDGEVEGAGAGIGDEGGKKSYKIIEEYFSEYQKAKKSANVAARDAVNGGEGQAPQKSKGAPSFRASMKLGMK